MDINSLLKELRKTCGNNHIKFPESIYFEYDEDTKTVHMKMNSGIKENMQENSAAFEGWALALKGNLEDYVHKVTLDWEEDDQALSEKNKAAWRHFNRFLYRVEVFSKKYSEWFSVKNKCTSWSNRMLEEGWKTLVLNKIGDRDALSTSSEYSITSEHDLEVFFTTRGIKKLKDTVKDNFNIEIGEIKNQYPVGLFNHEVNNNNYVFTGGKSAIDLYSIVDKESFNIFELKAENNVKIGIVSELFFYANLIRDVVDGKFKCDSPEMMNLKKVNAFFLIPRLHPLITEKVIDMLNVEEDKISFNKLIYSVSGVEFLGN